MTSVDTYGQKMAIGMAVTLQDIIVRLEFTMTDEQIRYVIKELKTVMGNDPSYTQLQIDLLVAFIDSFKETLE